MKKIVFIIFALFVCAVQADNVITSKEYVDTQASSLQEQISANDANTVLTYTDTAGTVGEKAIYDTTAAYGAQSDALVTAGAFNSAVQNALESEFVCVSRNDQGCLLYEIRAGTPKSASKNLFDINNAKVLYHNGFIQETKTNTGYTLTNSSSLANFILVEIGTINDLLGKTLTLSAKTTCPRDYINLTFCDDKGENRITQDTRTLYITEGSGNQTKVAMRLYLHSDDPTIVCDYYDIQVEEGTVATEYEPYKNLYIPSQN